MKCTHNVARCIGLGNVTIIEKIDAQSNSGVVSVNMVSRSKAIVLYSPWKRVKRGTDRSVHWLA